MSDTTATTTGAAVTYEADEAFARSMDARDPLRHQRDRFLVPKQADGTDVLYFCGNSLGLQPVTARACVEQELEDWASLGVEGHFDGRTPWYSYHEVFRETGARLVGARPGEVVMMNSLTVNLHLMMVSFFRPEGRRRKILMEAPAFPSDLYAIKTQLIHHGLDPKETLITIEPRDGEHVVRTEDLAAAIAEAGDELALVLIAGVNYYTGQVVDFAAITAAGHAVGAMVGFDNAHAAGNVPMRLHDWDVDFACWCSYKYLNAGPGAIAGCFVHERHGRNVDLPRFGGWWGNDPETRFRMHLEPEFVAKPDADGWQLSNPPIMAMAPLRASLAIFDDVGMDALRAKSRTLTGYLRWLIEREAAEGFEIITPRAEAQQGCQLSILVHDRPAERHETLKQAGVICDFRPPNVIRVAPVPLYNSYLDVWRFARTLTG